MQIFCFSPFGYEGSLVSVEVDLRRGIPAVDIVGLADGAVKESRERMRSAIRNSGFEFPPERVLISLSPADLKKEGAGFDLAIALAVLAAKNDCDSPSANSSYSCAEDSLQNSAETSCESNSFASEKQNEAFFPVSQNSVLPEDSILVMGELELNGSLRPIRAVHAAASTAFQAGIRLCIVPSVNADEAREVDGMKVFGAENLCDAFNALFSTKNFTKKQNSSSLKFNVDKNCEEINGIFFPKLEPGFEFSEIKGQEKLVRALQIAAAGGHNLLAFGPPGCGKTLSLEKFSALLPLLTPEESQSVTRIYSIAGLMKSGSAVILRPPFRQPHQTATIEGMCGGGLRCSPGEISLAHNGVLFLDEAAEFRSSVIQMLRVPLESGSITLSRAGRTTVFPAKFQLLMSTNPCPCGNFGSKEKICLCSGKAIEQYWKKFSAPLLDRVDIRVKVDSKNASLTLQNFPAKSTAELRIEIANAIKIQRERQGKKNVYLNPSEISKYCFLTQQVSALLENATEKNGFSPRAVSSCIKTARTIADMQCKENIDAASMTEAIEYRKSSGGMNFSFGEM